MSGSKREFAYQFNNGTVCAIIADESNVEQANGTSAAAATLGLIVLPIARQVRRARYTSTDKLHSHIVPILTQNDALAPVNSLIINKANGSGGVLTVEVFFRKAYAERFATGTGQDSGLNDGDTP